MKKELLEFINGDNVSIICDNRKECEEVLEILRKFDHKAYSKLNSNQLWADSDWMYFRICNDGYKRGYSENEQFKRSKPMPAKDFILAYNILDKFNKGDVITGKENPYEEILLIIAKLQRHAVVIKTTTNNVKVGDYLLIDYSKYQVIPDVEIALKIKQNEN